MNYRKNIKNPLELAAIYQAHNEIYWDATHSSRNLTQRLTNFEKYTTECKTLQQI